MNTGYVENGFIVDVSNAIKTSEIIYELSKILDLPDAQSKKVCLKLGKVDLTPSDLNSIKALVESMNSEIQFITTESEVTRSSAKEMNIEVSKLENEVPTPEFDSETVNEELEKALDKIFGQDTSEIKTFSDKKELKNLKSENYENIQEVVQELEIVPEIKSESTELTASDNKKEFEEFNSKLESANNIKEDEIEEIDYDLDSLRKSLRETEKLPTLYIQRTLRSGQSIKSEGNIVIIGDANPGSEIIAKGDITVWGVLGGIAYAGCDGNKFAKIRALKMNAIQLKIADIFARRPDSANIPFIQKSDTFVPEEASIERKQIIIHKIHEV